MVTKENFMANKVLMIDDDPELVDAVSNLLTAKGYDVFTASNGTEGIATAKKVDPDLIILDVMMTTQTEGFDIARALQADERLRAAPIVMLTGIRKEMSLPFGFEPDENWLPVRQVLEKPLKPEALLSAVAANIRTSAK